MLSTCLIACAVSGSTSSSAPVQAQTGPRNQPYVPVASRHLKFGLTSIFQHECDSGDGAGDEPYIFVYRYGFTIGVNKDGSLQKPRIFPLLQIGNSGTGNLRQGWDWSKPKQQTFIRAFDTSVSFPQSSFAAFAYGFLLFDHDEYNSTQYGLLKLLAEDLMTGRLNAALNETDPTRRLDPNFLARTLAVPNPSQDRLKQIFEMASNNSDELIGPGSVIVISVPKSLSASKVDEVSRSVGGGNVRPLPQYGNTPFNFDYNGRRGTTTFTNLQYRGILSLNGFTARVN